MEKITFDNLPEAVGLLLQKVEKIEKLLAGKTDEGPESQNLMGVKEAAVFLELSVATIYSKVCRGEIPAYKPGRKLYFDKALLIENIKSVRKKPLIKIADSVETAPTPVFKQKKRKAFRW